jgi:hypothetical protein
MSIPLVEALRSVDLRTGQTYRCEVNGLLVELRVLETTAKPDAPSISEADIMLDPWVELPKPPPIAFGRSVLGEPKLPDIPYIPPDEEAS